MYIYIYIEIYIYIYSYNNDSIRNNCGIRVKVSCLLQLSGIYLTIDLKAEKTI